MIALFLLFSGRLLSIITGKRILMLALTRYDNSHVLAYMRFMGKHQLDIQIRI